MAIDVNKLSDRLKSAIQKIQTKDSDGLSFEELYRHAYTMVLLKEGEKLYEGVREVVTEHLVVRVLKDILNAPNFLKKLNQAWLDHQNAMVMTKDIVMYLDRVYVQTSRVPNVFNLGLILFRSCILGYSSVQDRLRQTLVDMIALERRGGVIDRHAIRSTCQMMMILGQGSRSVYEENFERAFLDMSVQFFQTENRRFLGEKNSSRLIKKVEARILEEIQRVRSCFDKSTEEPLVKLMERELISPNMKTIVTEISGIIHMLGEDKTEDLARMYKLFSRTKGGVKTMCECLSTYLRNQGTALMSRKRKRINAVNIVQGLLDLMTRLDRFLLESFNNDREFKQTITRDFENFLSLNPRTPEFLSLFIDNKLRRRFNGLPEEEVESILGTFGALFKLTRDKQVFQGFYRLHFANRLLYNKNISEEYETKMLSKLAGEAGCGFIAILEGMLEDISTSVSAVEEYTQPSTEEPVDLTVKILTNGYWPMELDLNKYSIPPIVSDIFEDFRSYYLTKHPDRTLILQPHMGLAELNATFQGSVVTEKVSDEDDEGVQSSSNSPRRYILEVSTLQMIVLVLFNEREQWTFEEIQQKVNVTKLPLVSTLYSLACGRQMHNVLCKEPKSKDIEKDHVFVVNDRFSSRRTKVKMSNLKTLPMFP